MLILTDIFLGFKEFDALLPAGSEIITIGKVVTLGEIAPHLLDEWKCLVFRLIIYLLRIVKFRNLTSLNGNRDT